MEILQSVREQHAAAERKLAEAEAALERRLDGVEELAQVSDHARAGSNALNLNPGASPRNTCWQ